MNSHEGSRRGFESTVHKGREYIVHSGAVHAGVLPAGVPNKMVQARGSIASPMIHDQARPASALRGWAIEWMLGPDLWLPATGRHMRGEGKPTVEALRLGHSPGYRLQVLDTDTDSYRLDLPELPGNPIAVAVAVSKRSKMMPVSVSGAAVKAAAARRVGVRAAVVDVAAQIRALVAQKGWGKIETEIETESELNLNLVSIPGTLHRRAA